MAPSNRLVSPGGFFLLIVAAVFFVNLNPNLSRSCSRFFRTTFEEDRNLTPQDNRPKSYTDEYENRLSDSRAEPPEDADLANLPPRRCGEWYAAAPGDTCASVAKAAGQNLSLLLQVNPSLGNEVGAACDAKLEAGKTYCIVPQRYWEGGYYDLTHLGCWANTDAGVPVLRNPPAIRDESGMKRWRCASHCKEHAFMRAAIANGTDCLCGSLLTANSEQVDASRCAEPCPGDARETCGGADAVDLLSTNGRLAAAFQPERSGCYTNAGNATLGMEAEVAGPVIEYPFNYPSCWISCMKDHHTYFGITEGNECRCGDEIAPHAERVDDSKCDVLCETFEPTTCGGNGYIEIWGSKVDRSRPGYEFPPPSRFGFAPGRAVAAPATTVLASPTPTADFAAYECWGYESWPGAPEKGDRDILADKNDEGGINEDTEEKDDTPPMKMRTEPMSAAVCYDFCVVQHGKKLFALAGGGECICGDKVAPGVVRAQAGECSVPCPGNDAESCGGPRTSTGILFGTAPLPPLTGYAPVKTNFSAVPYYGCKRRLSGLQESRWMPAVRLTIPGLTIDACARQCIIKGYSIFAPGMGDGCICSFWVTEGFVAAYEAQCDAPCAGNATQVCGGDEYFSLYGWDRKEALRG